MTALLWYSLDFERVDFIKQLHSEVMASFDYHNSLWHYCSNPSLDSSMTGASKVVRKANSRLNTTWNMSQGKAASNFPYIPPLYVYVDLGWMCRIWCKAVHAHSTVSACLPFVRYNSVVTVTFSYLVLYFPMCSPNTHKWGADQNTVKKCPCLW